MSYAHRITAEQCLKKTNNNNRNPIFRIKMSHCHDMSFFAFNVHPSLSSYFSSFLWQILNISLLLFLCIFRRLDAIFDDVFLLKRLIFMFQHWQLMLWSIRFPLKCCLKHFWWFLLYLRIHIDGWFFLAHIVHFYDFLE